MIFLQAAIGLELVIIFGIILISLIGAPVLAIVLRIMWKNRDIKKARKEGLEIGFSRNADWGDIISSYLISLIVLIGIFFLAIYFLFKNVNL